MSGLFERLFGPPERDEISEIRSALGRIVKYALKEQGGTGFTLRIWDCEISGVPVGSWQFDVTRIAQAGEAGTAETVKQGSVHEHAVGSADAPKG